MTLALTSLLVALGPWAVLLLAALVFAETGLLVGFFLPGDSLLFAAGLFAATGAIGVPVALLVAVVAAAAVLGDLVGYRIGRRFGPRLFGQGLLGRRGSRFLSAEHLHKARRFFDKYGDKAVILARFVAVARTFTPVVAGAVQMPARRFAIFNVVGAVLWASMMILAGFFLGGVPVIAAHVELFTIGLLAAVTLPALALWVARRVQARFPALANVRRVALRRAGRLLSRAAGFGRGSRSPAQC